MKYTLLLMLCLMCAPILAQSKKKPKKEQPKLEMDSVSGKYIFRRVVQCDTLRADILFDRALQWVPTMYRDANSVVQYQDKEAGKIIVKGVVKDLLTLGFVRHILTIEVKDGRFRYTFSDFVEVSSTGGIPMETPAEAKGMFQKANRDNYAQSAQNIGLSLEKALTIQESADGW